MSVLYYAASYKNKIINLLLKNRNFVTLINPVSESECEYLDEVDILLGGKWVYGGKEYKEQGYIFDYNFVNDTIEDEKTFVFVETDISSVRQKMFVDFNLYVHIFTAKPLVRLSDKTAPTVKQVKDMGYFTSSTYANRIDILCNIVDEILNGNEKIPGLGTVTPSDRDFCVISYPSNKYYGKRLKYKITNLNEIEDSCEN